MPSRRALLATSGTAAATALAGCSALGSPDGSPAEVRPGRDLRPEDAEVVARTTADRTGCPAGDVGLTAIGFELPDGDLQMLTKVDVFPGQQECGSDWDHDEVHVSHDWADPDPGTESLVMGTESNVIPTESGGEARLENTSNAETGAWRVHRVARPGDIEQYNFRSTYASDGVGTGDGALIDEGEELGAVTAEVARSTGGLLGGDSETVTLSETLVYGDTRAS